MGGSPLKLNLGCGRVRLPGFLNADRHGGEIFCDAMALPFRDRTFDEILMSHSLEHIHNIRRAVLEVHRVLRRGGLFTVVVPYGLRFLYNVNHFHAFTLISMDPFTKVGDSLQDAPLFRLLSREITDYTFFFDRTFHQPWKWHIHRHLPFWFTFRRRGIDSRIRTCLPLGPRREITFVLEAI